MRDIYDSFKAKQEKPAKEVKVVKTFRQDPDVLEWLEEKVFRKKPSSWASLKGAVH